MSLKNEDSEVRVIVISPDSSITPATIIAKIAASNVDILYKETCFGVIIEGPPKNVEVILTQVRQLDPNRIFTKKRGYHLGDPRICRKKRGGAARPGFHFIEFEQSLLPLIANALEKTEKEDLTELSEEPTPLKKLDPRVLKEIIEKKEP